MRGNAGDSKKKKHVSAAGKNKTACAHVQTFGS